MTDLKTTPRPGSPAAIAIGCRCPAVDNCHGMGVQGEGTDWWYRSDCTVHRDEMRARMLRTHQDRIGTGQTLRREPCTDPEVIRAQHDELVADRRRHWIGGVPDSAALRSIHAQIAHRLRITAEDVRAALDGHPQPIPVD
jgi:hypothetical protein